ncbi:hypothetical protein [Nesterenkonia sphaerica]|uniref:Uncharacterized protein n=1 Tax=Nesterenkonia sphaerica TaxID=1804988 RepID=A0A5R9ANR2_9MICC|nr:hypothetical protein [Nesterenkonia sphaerica]TLP79536.1 hypothetical protein FEF27_02815 [Nesterenkonia sphaerica]
MQSAHSGGDAGGLQEHLHTTGKPFSSAELQAMTQRGAMRHVVSDVYAENVVPDSPAVRAAAAAMLLNSALAEHGVLCGETAAWVHLGTAAPKKLTVLVDAETNRRFSVRKVQLHRSRLSPEDVERFGPTACTTSLRTAADLFCGTGVRHLRRALDRIAEGYGRAERILQRWPCAQSPLWDRDEDLWHPGPEDERIMHQRWHTIDQLLHQSQSGPWQLADLVMRILSRTGWDHQRHRRIGELIAQCVSRRLPTVR